jgi:opacity protein-like surface antigen
MRNFTIISLALAALIVPAMAADDVAPLYYKAPVEFRRPGIQAVHFCGIVPAGLGTAGTDFMRRHFVTLVASFAIGAATVAANAHHSIAVFDQSHPIELAGTVQEFRFTSPHTFIVLEVVDKDSNKVVWNLEGNSPNSLSWDGWSHNTLKPGDELRLTIFPLRSGAPGGAWYPNRSRHKDGSPIVVAH